MELSDHTGEVQKKVVYLQYSCYQNIIIRESVKKIEVLEQDEYFLRAKRIEIPASITACEFYIKQGYNYKNGIKKIDEERLYRLEKHR